MKRARLAFTLMSLGFGMAGGVLSGKEGLLGFIGVLLIWAGGITIASAFGFNFPKLLSDKWPDLYPPDEK